MSAESGLLLVRVLKSFKIDSLTGRLQMTLDARIMDTDFELIAFLAYLGQLLPGLSTQVSLHLLGLYQYIIEENIFPDL